MTTIKHCCCELGLPLSDKYSVLASSSVRICSVQESVHGVRHGLSALDDDEQNKTHRVHTLGWLLI